MKRLLFSILIPVWLFPSPASAESALPSDFWLLSRAEVIGTGHLSLKIDGWGVNEDLFPEYQGELFGRGSLQASYGFWGRLEGGFLSALEVDQAGIGGGRKRDIAPGDFSGYLRLRLAGDRYSRAILAAEAFGSVPTGSGSSGLMRSGHYTSGDIDTGGRLLLSLRAPLYHVHLNLGGIDYQGAESNGAYDEPFLVYGAGMELFPEKKLSPWGEFGGLTPSSAPGEYRLYPLWSAAGIILRPFAGTSLTMAARYNLSDRGSSRLFDWQRERFRFRAGLTIHWHLFHRRPPDTDFDGVPDAFDLSPYLPEDVDNFLDSDGAPDWDNDGDGIADRLDADPLRPEDADGFQDQDGAPDWDNDGDGIPDSLDVCPDLPEDFDGYKDDDGCPDNEVDTDGDGIPDPLDGDPIHPEDRDGFQDEDGIPDPDNDGDGIPDFADKCPNQPETVNGYMDDDGCPDEPPGPSRPGAAAARDEAPASSRLRDRTVIEGLVFASGRSDILPESYPALDRIAERIKARPGARFEIRGYTDSRGDAAVNLQLSLARAKSVRSYLLTKGISADRLAARGLGESDPRAPNDTASGRARNRRVELVRVD